MIAILKTGMGMADPGRPSLFVDAAWAILVAMIFDALDGFVARVTRTTSTFGAQLDSLCDLVTFGVAPGFLAFAVSRANVAGSSPWERPVLAVCILYAMCALVRLARFTVETTPDESSHREFAGLPSPAAAGVLASAVLPTGTLQTLFPAVGPDLALYLRFALPGLALATGILMVSRIRYAHVINRLLKGKRPFVTLIEMALLIVLLVVFREFAFFIAFFIYALTGPALWIRKRFGPRKVAAAGAPAPQAPSHSQDAF
jgi:CDP-diacylglycerol--serine O-phosphatidyltransferase